MNLTLNDYITSSGAFPERANSDELTKEVKLNACILIDKVNALLNELEFKGSIKLSSGFRPSVINSNTQNSAKKSGHMIGKALDIMDDKNQTLAKFISSRPDLLRKYELFMEDMKSTKGKNTNWVHLDFIVRQDRPSRTFIP